MASHKTRRDRSYQTAVHTAVTSAMFATAIAAYFVFAKQPPARETARSDIGKLIMRRDGDCKAYDFNNSTGAISETHMTDCSSATGGSTPAAPTNRLESIRRGFADR
jgi:hypothetical protein